MKKQTSGWERVTDDTTRLRVPGGWLYRVLVSPSYGEDGGVDALAVTFVPWDVSTPTKAKGAKK